ncbi:MULTISPECIES: ABC transporter substrate-binding protein [unclassified Shinella]|uniref:ABC transporter substrate-binding protein n=1 Tax=unclassified Shinella TaxID=2643062 RepID=UPI00225D18BC|nr:extracellular solute-binding protein [Shinella sp. YE25]MDC7258976.1 substrate-binding domain-containing protein [Shinella sp. YE25]CAI0334634.1 ABC transporter substrate-binding protein [Rhizobiaceae bacterium]
MMRFLPEFLRLRGAGALLLLMALVMPGFAAAQERTLRLAGVVSEARMAPLIVSLSVHLPGTRLVYSRLSSAQIAAAARRPHDAPFDIAFLSSPDVAVSIANEGYAISDEAAGAMAGVQWRNEVFGFWSDPAVIVVRKAAFENRVPRTRIELVRMLEQNTGRFARRVGVVNVGIDDVGYLLASQDSIRTSLYWRLIRALGGAKARIYDTTDDLLEALQAGDLDVAYNVPLSALRAGGELPQGMEVLVPQDYVLAVPWTVLMPKGAANLREARILLHMLLAPEGKAALAAAGFVPPQQPSGFEGLQKIELGPELLVFRDMIKRSRFLDAWFQMVVG